ncbi:hypothetical protein EDM56_19975 [Brevibacillus fluminis]|uniref:Uncharacterized protein n=1 Tax=Brevibacillus fluminis TaxID=511487 RepID=A0A3M8DBZ7_9BACL|nr:hypothetical protein EDM56_19975 [Brevibacillus fluminis]
MFLSNGLIPVSSLIMNAAFNCLENRSPEASHVKYKDYHIPVERLPQFIGEYQEIAKSLSIPIRLQEGQLQMLMHNNPLRLKPIGEDFFYEWLDERCALNQR